METIKPLTERLRPISLDTFIGQTHLVGENAILRKTLTNGTIPSMILWGPPGVGKTTLAGIIAQTTHLPFYTLSAISSGVKDVRETIELAKTSGTRAILFIDEIHRFNKAQQDSLLGAVEQGIITLIGATTENPSFEVITPLLSRCQTYILKTLEEEDLLRLITQAKEEEEKTKKKTIHLLETDALLRISGGDARKLLNAFELVINEESGDTVNITNQQVVNSIQQNLAIYDKGGEQHYDIISAFIKSIRGSDPNAAVYWLARMIEGGEDPKFIARRLLILASEDIGNANPNALLLANTCFQAVTTVGYPECRIILSQTTIYLATSEKSNASYMAINEALQLVKQTGNLSVPLHLRNAPTALMKEVGYGKAYKYAHDYPNNFVAQEFMPDAISGKTLYKPQQNAKETSLKAQLKKWWGNKYGY